MKPGKEQRRSQRVEVDGELLLDIHSDNVIKTDTVNISASGINFLSSAPIPMFRELEIKLTLPPVRKNRNVHVLKCHGVVVRCSKKDAHWHEVSLFFEDLGRDARAAIDDFVSRRAGAKKLIS